VLADATLSPFFLDVDIERLKQTQEGFFAVALGGPGAYTGRSLPDAHARTRQRGLTHEVFGRFLAVFRGVLVDLGLPDDKVEALVAMLETTRVQVLNR
jgi:hemoglobin